MVQPYIDSNWAYFIADMFGVQGQPNIYVSITGNEAALSGMSERGDEFTIALYTDEAGVAAVRSIAGLLRFPVREFQHYPALVDATEEASNGTF